MNIYTLTEEHLSTIRASVDRLSKLRFLLPGALEYAMDGHENRREFLTEMIARIERPADMNEAIIEELNQIRIVLTQIELRRL